ncbi:MAG: GNAT family N-acetyltransferase/peptidase C39 family protein [Gammaproteobacteria bacterium]|nr:GNAT family N-acetyltransferase/peptidase C39 family protein [Gammaproteobacteria bacterium]
MTTVTPTTLSLATINDLEALVAIEKRCFDYDRMSSRSIKHMIQKGNCDFILARQADVIVGYILILYHRGTHLARIYSFAVLPEFRGQGIGEQLLQDGEKRATLRKCIYMRLEVHPNNSSAIRMYEKYGYHPFGLLKNYYEDHADAHRYQKRILYREERSDFLSIPYYEQTTDFTCGPACLIMAMQALRKDTRADRSLELQLWREATTIYMTSGHGGCSPLGLALAAWRRDFRVELYVNTQEPLFLDGVRSDAKKAVMELVHQDFMAQINETDIEIEYNPISLDQLEAKFKQGGIPLVLISCYSYTRDKAPHWVVVAGIDDTFVYIHDPDEDEDTYRSRTDNIYLPIARPTFDKSFRFGRTGLRTSVIIFPKNK